MYAGGGGRFSLAREEVIHHLRRKSDGLSQQRRAAVGSRYLAAAFTFELPNE